MRGFVSSFIPHPSSLPLAGAVDAWEPTSALDCSKKCSTWGRRRKRRAETAPTCSQKSENGGSNSAASTRKSWRCLPGIQTVQDAIPIPSLTHPDGLPHVPGYEVEAVLGRGGMGVVYKARHLALKRTVALKMIAGGHPHPAEQARFRAEAEAVARLQHPNIVQIHEIGEADGRPFFALEFVDGGWLAERLAGQSLPPATRPAWWRRWPRPCTWPTAATSSTATSSRRTCSWSARPTRRSASATPR